MPLCTRVHTWTQLIKADFWKIEKFFNLENAEIQTDTHTHTSPRNLIWIPEFGWFKTTFRDGYRRVGLRIDAQNEMKDSSTIVINHD